MTIASADQGFTAYGAKLFTTAAPYDPVSGVGNPDDTAAYTRRPGIDFLRPWLAIQGDIAFQWPVGLQGFTYTIDPILGKHTFIGDNKVVVDVIHTGTEALTLTGSFPGNSSPSLMSALREVVRRVADAGKILYVPEVMTHAQRVQVDHFETGHDESVRSRDLTYSIEFSIVGIVGPALTSSRVTSIPTQSTAPNRGTSARTFSTTSAYNTLRKVAAYKLGSADNWRKIYDLNHTWFDTRLITVTQAPDYRMPAGVSLAF